MRSDPSRPEPEIEEAFDRLVDEGAERLERPLLALVATGLLGGIDIGFGVLAYLVVKDQTDDPLLASLAFSIGFVALLLARSELFTENFLVPVTAVAAKSGTVRGLARLWGVTLVCNLLGGAFIAAVLVAARPDLKKVAVEAGETYADLGTDLRSFCLAVLAGAAITLMTRMHHGTESPGVRVVSSLLFGTLLVGAELLHCVLDGIFMFAAVIAGGEISALTITATLSWAILGNLVGGIGLVTAIRLLRVPQRLAEERQHPEGGA